MLCAQECVRDRAALLVRVGTEATAELTAELQQQQLQQHLRAEDAEMSRAAPPSPAFEAAPVPLSDTEARRIVGSVFDRCYNDLSPFGRRLRGRGHNSVDAQHALELKHLRDRIARLYPSSSLTNDSNSHH